MSLYSIQMSKHLLHPYKQHISCLSNNLLCVSNIQYVPFAILRQQAMDSFMLIKTTDCFENITSFKQENTPKVDR